MTTDVSIVAMTLEALAAEEVSGAALAEVLAVAPPADWPPLFNDAGVRSWFRAQITAHPDNAKWFGYYVIAGIDGVPTLAGTAGFKGPPAADGRVEIGYSILPAYQRRGIAVAAVGRLLQRAFGDPAVTAICAETLADAAASQGVLRKSGFAPHGHRFDPEEGEISVFTLSREAWALTKT